jgi:sigma-B regulation protein RsbU (phosphoserine phosphatase)
MVRVLLHAAPAGSSAPDEILARLNAQLAGTLSPGRFVTACIAALEPRSGRLEYSLAGHPPPWIVREPAGTPERLECRGGLPLGAFGDARFERGEAVLWPGDTLVLLTDGVIEAMDPNQELFGEDRLQAALAATDGQDLAAVSRGLLARIETHRAGAALSDDLSLLLVRRLATGGRAAGTPLR